MMRSDHPNFNIASPYMSFGSWSLILSLLFLRLAKIDFGPMSSAESDSFRRLL